LIVVCLFGRRVRAGRAADPTPPPKITALRRRNGGSQIVWELIKPYSFLEGKSVARRQRHQRKQPVAKKFVDELKIFQVEEAAAQQYFFGYLTVTQMAVENSEFLELVHTYPWFWITAHHAMFMATFVALGRIFDQDTPHNVDALMSAVSAQIKEFSVDTLKARCSCTQNSSWAANKRCSHSPTIH
jgi:hypothetical protein